MSDSLLVALIGGASSVLVLVVKHYLEKGNNNLNNINTTLIELKVLAKKTADGTRILSRYRLLQDMDELIERGYITLKELRDITTLYHSYKELEGNGAVTEMFERFKNLPVKNDKGGK